MSKCFSSLPRFVWQKWYQTKQKDCFDTMIAFKIETQSLDIALKLTQEKDIEI